VLLYLLLGPGYAVGGTAVLVLVAAMILLDAVHLPAVSTAVML
jgi:hypothetical protein